MRGSIQASALKRLVIAGVLTATVLTSFTGCSAETTEFKPDESIPVSSTQQVDGEKQGSGIQIEKKLAVLDISNLKSEEFDKTQAANVTALAEYQKKWAADNGYVATEHNSVFGHTIYMEKGDASTKRGYGIFSGSEFLKGKNNINDSRFTDMMFELYSEKSIYSAFNSDYDVMRRSGLKMETGELIASSDKVVVSLDDQIREVRVNGIPFQAANKESRVSWGNEEGLMLSALTQVSGNDMESYKTAYKEADSDGKVLTTSTAKYRVITATSDFLVGFDGTDRFILATSKMCTPKTGDMLPDTMAYDQMINQNFSSEGVQLTGLELKIGQEFVVYDADTKQISEHIVGITKDSDGKLHIGFEGLQKGLGATVQFIELDQGDNWYGVDVITDSQFNMVSAGDARGITTEQISAENTKAQKTQEYVKVTKEQAEKDAALLKEKSDAAVKEALEKEAAKKAEDEKAESGKTDGGKTNGGKSEIESPGKPESKPSDPGYENYPANLPEEVKRSNYEYNKEFIGAAEPQSGAVADLQHKLVTDGFYPILRWRSDIGMWEAKNYSGIWTLIYPTNGGSCSHEDMGLPTPTE